jgi:glycosyltransferase involved in cell wall biosynthesis
VSAPTRIGLDATPLLGHRTGIGVYTQRLIAGLAGAGGVEVVGSAFTLRGATGLRAALPASVRERSRPIPARALRAAWARTDFPPVEWLCGRVDVFHGTNFVLPPTRRARGVVSVHDLSFLRYPETVSADSRRYVELVPRSVRRASTICVLTEAMGAEVAAEYGVDPARIFVTPPGVDESWFAAAPLSESRRAELDLPERYLVAVGSLEPRKNLPRLIEAYGRLRKDDPEAPTLVLVGPPGWGPALELGALPEGAVRLTGYLDDPTLRSVVAGAQCLVYPSLYEGFGLPPVEALAAGVPVLASDLPVTREVLGDAAMLVSGTDVDALAAGLAAMLRADRAGDRERRRAQARRWTWEGCVDATLDAYAAALA